MPIELDPVRPGDLITAELMNEVLDCLRSLDERVGGLEAGVIDDGSVHIIRRVPAGSVTVGQELQVYGRNFQYSIGAHRVFLGTFRVRTFVPGSHDELLVFVVPSLPNLPADGVVTMSISNQTTTDSVDLHILPAEVTLEGNIELGYQSSSPLTPLAGNPISFNYRLFSRLNQPADIAITPTITGVPDPAQWQPLLQLRNAAGAPLANNSIRLEPLQAALFSVRLSQIPTGAGNATFTVNVSAAAGGVSSPTESRQFTVGTQAEQQDETFTLDFFGANPTTAVQGGEIRLAESGLALITLVAEFTLAGRYNLSQSIVSGNAWSVERNTETTPAFYDVTEGQLGNLAARTRSPEFIVRANAGAATSGQVRFTIQRQGATVLRSVLMPLVRI